MGTRCNSHALGCVSLPRFAPATAPTVAAFYKQDPKTNTQSTMKIFNYRALMMAMAVFSLVYLTACGDDEDELLDPSISITSVVPDSVEVGGTTLSFELNAVKGVDGANLRNITVRSYTPLQVLHLLTSTPQLQVLKKVTML